MWTEPVPTSAAACRWIARAAAILAILTGGGHVLAWVAGLMSGVTASTIIMKTNAGLGLSLSGLALLLLCPPRPRDWRRHAARACAVIVVFVGVATLGEHLVGWNLGIDQLLAMEPAGAKATVSPNRMGPPASLSLALTGIALLLLARRERRQALHQPLAFTVAVLALLSIVGYLYQASQLFAVARVTASAWPTAVTLLVLSVGVFCARPTEGLMARVTADDAGGAIVRALLGPIVFLPLAFGWVRVTGERLGWFDSAMGTALMMVLFIVTYLSLLLFTAVRVGVASNAARASEAALRDNASKLSERAAELEAVLDSLQDAVFVYDAEGKGVRTNPAALELYGVDLTGDLVAEKAANDLRIRRLDGTEMPTAELPSRRALAGERVARQHYLFRGRDGADRVGEASATPLVVDGAVVGAVAIAHDVTEQRKVEEALRQSEEKFSKAFHGNTAAMTITRMRDGMYLEVNDSFVKVTGFGRNEAVGRTTADLNIWREPADRDAFVSMVRRDGVVRDLECHFVRKNGERWIANVSSQVSEIGGEPALISSFSDVTEIKTAEQALREANERLRVADQRKDEFLAVLSHELRNPLAPVRAALYVLERAVPGGEQANSARKVIDRQINQLTRLVDDLLDVTRIARGKIVLQREPVELVDLVRKTAEDHRALFTERDIRLRVDVPGGDIWVDGDAQRLAQAVGNLLHNAAKFTGPGGMSTIRVTCDAAAAVIAVSDDGIGISEASLPHIFEPFMQADRTIDRARGGLGLGLSLVKSLVEMHGGTVSATSPGPGRGAEFEVRLTSRPAPIATASPQPARRGRARRIFIIEDNVDAADTLRQALELAGHEVEVAYDGVEGLEKARSFRPDIVLCDIGLPGMNGYEVAREFRDDEALQSVHLVALTGYALPEDLVKAREAGFDLHIAKPPDPVKLQEAIAILGTA